MTLRAVIVGLGKVAWRFDREPGRKVVWTHLGAYTSLPSHYHVVGVCDPAPAARAEFSKQYECIPVFNNSDALLSATSPDVVSICAPAEHHASLIRTVAMYPSVKTIWCEKPLAVDIASARDAVGLCEAKRIRLVVSHVRRWVPLWRAAKELTATLGQVRVVRVSMANRLWSIGSHAVDLALMLGGTSQNVTGLDIPSLYEEGEPARAALIGFTSGAYGIVQVTGTKSQILVEAEVIGDDGRMLVREDRGEIAVEQFAPSTVYAGYRQLANRLESKHETLLDFSPFIAVAADIAACAENPDLRLACEGSDALEGMLVLGKLSDISSGNKTA